MGHGRHARSLIRCILLLASAIQGITPDSHNLASPFAISLLDPSSIGRSALLDDDHSPDDACEAIEESRPWRAHQQELACRTGHPGPNGRASDHSSSMIGTRSNIVAERLCAQDLPLTLCRLVC
jgi:hypothetical protein